ncbi:hypothetical protein FGLOB1_6164 [Fusarium globosum]|uniref:Uncharacterized protein n=1 Tax=Fusarium globosum TaxID=78864 RepID=A0A8H6D9W2_9HYPO|nr:hypothetical protein FGLOB1_6164 [Fusarium globosum]
MSTSQPTKHSAVSADQPPMEPPPAYERVAQTQTQNPPRPRQGDVNSKGCLVDAPIPLQFAYACAVSPALLTLGCYSEFEDNCPMEDLPPGMEGIHNEWVDPDISPPGLGSDSDSDDATASIGQKRKSSRRASSMKKRKRVSAKFEWADAVPSRNSKRLEAQQVNENDVCDENRRYAETLLKMINPFYSPGDLTMNLPDEAPYFCMADTRCRLCQFELQEDDLVIAHIEGQRFSMEFNLRMADTIHDSFEWINLHTCANPQCMAEGRRIPFFHNDCFCFRLYDISDALVAAGNYTFDPPAYEKKRRSHRIKRLLAPKLRDELQIRLPAETLMIIAGLLVRECAAITAEEQLLGLNVSDDTVDLTKDVYVGYTAVDGVRYVRSLGNTVSKLCNQDCPVLLSKQGESVGKIWIAEDYRGIRAVKFCSADTSLTGPTPIAKSWWRAICVPCDVEKIATKSDGLKLRDILTCDEKVSTDTRNYIGWAKPEHPNDVIDITTFDQVNSFPERLRMTFFNCNVNGTTGYTAVTCGSSVAMVHAHENDNTGFYADMDSAYPRGFFIYMPLDDGEFVTEICRRYAVAAGNWISTCLVFITNKGRNTLFGTSGPPESCLVLDRILTPAFDGTQIWYNDLTSVHPKSLRYIACDRLAPPVQRPFPPSLIPNPPYFWTQNNEPCCGTLSWMQVSRHGTLEWWSSLRHSIVRYTSTAGQLTNMETRS